jgi:hypothetical protein
MSKVIHVCIPSRPRRQLTRAHFIGNVDRDMWSGAYTCFALLADSSKAYRVDNVEQLAQGSRRISPPTQEQSPCSWFQGQELLQVVMIFQPRPGSDTNRRIGRIRHRIPVVMTVLVVHHA